MSWFFVTCVCCARPGEGVGIWRTGKSSFLIPSSELVLPERWWEAEMLGGLGMLCGLSRL